MGGVINIITKKAKKEGLSGEMEGESGSWNFWKSKMELTGKIKNFDFYLEGSRPSADDYEAKGYGKIKNTSYDEESFYVKLGYEARKDDLLPSQVIPLQKSLVNILSVKAPLTKGDKNSETSPLIKPKDLKYLKRKIFALKKFLLKKNLKYKCSEILFKKFFDHSQKKKNS